MADRILTLCDKCAEEMRIRGMRVKQVSGRTTTEKKNACEFCGYPCGGTCRQYIVGGKGQYIVGGKGK